MKEKIYNKLIPFLILIQPLFDIFTSVSVHLNYNFTIGIFVKILLIFLFIIYLIFIDKKHLLKNLLFLSIIFIFLLFNLVLNIDVIKVGLFIYFGYLVKFIYLILIIYYFIRWFKNGNKIKLYQFRIPLIILTISFFFALITKSYFPSYDIYRKGTSGWFNSPNELGALLTLLFPVSLYNAFHNPEKKKIDFILFVCIGYMLLALGTKVGLLGFFIVLISYLLYRFITIKNNKFDFKIIFIILVLIISFLCWNYLPAVYNTNYRMQQNNVEEINEKSIDLIIYSGRDEYFEQVQEKRENIGILSKIFGKSYLKETKQILITEQDFYDIYYMYGLYGFLLTIITIGYTLFICLKSFILNFKINIYDYKIICCFISVLLALCISYISGHVLLSPSVSTFLVIVLIILYSKSIKINESNKKRIIIYMPKLSVGGMEQALINLLNMSTISKKYDVDLYLGYSIEKEYLSSIPKNVNVVLLCKRKWDFIGKLITIFKITITYINLLVNPYKYYASISYSYQHGILSKLTRLSSHNNVIFIHNDLLKCREPKQLKHMMKKLQYDKFKKVVCVSNCVKKSFKTLYPKYNGKIYVINNYINYDKVLNLSKEKIKDLGKSKKITFINVGRHEEKAKKITRIIEASKMLLKEKYDFRVVLIGDGINHNEYIDLVKKYRLGKNITLLGKKTNPYPYFLASDCFVMSSEYEGYGLVFDEARVLNLPIISTDVADSKAIMNEGYGILCDNSVKGIYTAMKQFLEKGYRVKEKFDYKKFNNNISKKLDILIKDK